MGKVIKKKLNGMSWWMKTSLVLLLTLATSVFMYQGLYKPMQAKAATVSYIVVSDVATALVADGTANLPAAQSTTAVASATVPTFKAALTTVAGTALSWRPGSTIAGPAAFMNVYGPVYATAQTLTAITTTMAIRSGTATDTWTAHIYDYNPAGAAQNGTLVGTSNTITATGGQTTTDYAFTYTGTVTIPATHRFVVKLVKASGVAATLDRIYYGAAPGAATGCGVVVTEAAASTANLLITDGTALTTANAPQGSIDNVVDSFTMAMSSAATGAVTSLTVLGDANFTATNIPTNGVEIYKDNGTTVGVWDASDTLISTASTAISGNATTVTLTSESVTATPANYLVVVNMNGAATLANTFTATVSGAGGTSLGTVSDTDTAGKTLTVTAGAILNVAESTTEATSMSAPRSSTFVLDSFSMATTSGTSTVTAVTVTGNASFLAANIGTNAVHIYRDNGVIGTLDGADVQLSTLSPAIVATATTITLTTPETVTQASANYLVVVDIAAAATISNAITGTVSGVTQTGAVSVSDTDAASATLTVAAAQTLTISNSTIEAAAANIKTGATAALNTFQLALNAGTGTVASLTLTGSAQFTTANISSAAVYIDNGTVGTYDAGVDTLVPSSYSQTGVVGTITFNTPLAVSVTAVKYIVVVSASGSATVSNTFSGTITTATGSGIGTPASTDTNTIVLTVIAGPVATIGNCGGCHFYTGIAGRTPADTTGRNTPVAGLFQGNHLTHAGPSAVVNQYGFVCTTCHYDNGTSPTGNSHQRGFINVTGSKLSGSAYNNNVTVPGVWNAVTHQKTVSQTPALYACSNTYCHSNGQSVLGTVVINANTSPSWGATAGSLLCNGCHGVGIDGRPEYLKASPKRNTHGYTDDSYGKTHRAQACTVCHTGIGGTAGAYTIMSSANHVNGDYNLRSTLNYVKAAGTCTNVAGCHPTGTVTWGGDLLCIDCHASAQPTSLATRALDATVTSRDAVVGEFSLTWSHKRSFTGTPKVVDADCIVCHMEGNVGGGKSTVHGNGYINLRDPDTGLNIKNVTFAGTGAGLYTEGATDVQFVRFRRDYSKKLEADPLFLTIAAVQQNHCLKCHDTLGATNINARVPTTGTPLQPFGVAITGHAAPYDSNGVGNVVDVNKSFKISNSSYHPVIGRANNWFAKYSAAGAAGGNMIAPWRGPFSSRGATVNATAWGNLISCWDCHAASGTANTASVARTTTAHGAALTLRAPIRVAGTTAVANLCVNCHKLAYATTGTAHGANTAFSAGNSNMGAGTFGNCSFCHAYSLPGAAQGTTNGSTSTLRPLRGEDAHGFNDRTPGTIGSKYITSNVRPYGFIRNQLQPIIPLSTTASGETLAGTAGTCTGVATSTCNTNMGNSNYGGGTY